LSGALCSLRKGWEEEQGDIEGFFEALHAGMGTGIGKAKCGDVGPCRGDWNVCDGGV
jgi:hypothetical protein